MEPLNAPKTPNCEAMNPFDRFSFGDFSVFGGSF